MRRAHWVLLAGSLLIGGFLMWADTGPAARPPGVLLGLEGTSWAAPSELHWRDPADPHDRRPSVEFVLPPPDDGMRVGLEVLVDGRPLRTVRYDGGTYLPVPRLGTEYEIRVHNYGPSRITALVSVDGLSVINGSPSSSNHPGYIVAARGDVVIKGWRRNLDTVAAFSFEEREKSYASRMGYPDNIGVISLLAIEERRPRLAPLLENKDSAGPAAVRKAGEVGSTGTGYGRDVDSSVYYVSFVRSNNTRTVTLYYDTRDALRRAGVPVDDPGPLPFPREKEFAPPPPGDRRR